MLTRLCRESVKSITFNLQTIAFLRRSSVGGVRQGECGAHAGCGAHDAAALRVRGGGGGRLGAGGGAWRSAQTRAVLQANAAHSTSSERAMFKKRSARSKQGDENHNTKGAIPSAPTIPAPPAPVQRPQLVFHCQQAQGSPTGLISGFGNVKELYAKIAECYDFPADDVRFKSFSSFQLALAYY